MNWTKKVFVYFFLIGITLNLFSQDKDSLDFKNFSELSNLFYKHENDSLLSKKIAILYLNKAKSNSDSVKIADGYYFLSSTHKNNEDLFLDYNDSIIFISKRIRTRFYPIIGYFNKGDYYYKKRLFYKSLENYLLAEKHTNNNNNNDFYYDLKHRLGLLKSRFGNDKEALKLFKQTYTYHLTKTYNITNVDYHLPIVYALSDSYLRNKKLDSARYFSSLGFDMSMKNNNLIFADYFRFEMGLIEYSSKEYKYAIDSISKSLNSIIKNKDLANVSFANYFLGKSNLKMNKKEVAISYFKKVDSIYQITHDIHPDLRKSYEFIIEYYKNKSDLKNELTYIRKLLEVDRKLNRNYNLINSFMVRNYDTPKLLSEQKKIINILKRKSNFDRIKLLLLIFILFCSSVFGFYHFKKRKAYKKRGEEIPKYNSNTDGINHKTKNAPSLNIPQEIIDDVLKNLEYFEKNKVFLTKNLTLNFLAKEFNTNTTYLSKIINHSKGLSFSNYINQLRINYIVEELKTNQLYRKYTIKALAEEIGFNNAESFSKAFHKLKGIKPSFFINQLNKM